MAVLDITYEPEPTAAKFHASNKRIRGLAGAVGQGKTTAIIFEILALAEMQHVFNNKRSSRVIIVRNTYPELEANVVKEFVEWFPPEMLNVVYKKPIQLTMRFEHSSGDGTIVDLDMMAIGLDHPTSVGRLRGWNGSFGWINEADLVHKQIFDMVDQRVGRWPGTARGGVNWGGIMVDYNMPDISNWVYQVLEVEGFRDRNGNSDSEVFHIEPPLYRLEGDRDGGYFYNGYTYYESPLAEGVKFQPKGIDYWFNYMQNKDDRTIRRFVLGQYVPTKDGKPVFDCFDPDKHVSPKELFPVEHRPCWAMFDWGHHAACMIFQIDDMGRLLVLDEFYKGSIGLNGLLTDAVGPKLREKYRGIKFNVVKGDPTGRADSIQKDVTPFVAVTKFFSEAGYADTICGMAFTNSVQARYESAVAMMTRPGMLLISPTCTWLINGLAGNYRYKPRKGTIGEFEPTPDKDDPHCVPIDYQILTPSGWKESHQIRKGDVVYGYLTDGIDNPDDHGIMEDVITGLSFAEKQRTIVLSDNGKPVLESTLGHRNLVLSDKDYIQCSVRTDTMDKVYLVSMNPHYPSELDKSSLICTEGLDRLESHSDVWCPQTTSSYWICRTPEGRVFVTGNSHINDTFQYACVEFIRPGQDEETASGKKLNKGRNKRRRR